MFPCSGIYPTLCPGSVQTLSWTSTACLRHVERETAPCRRRTHASRWDGMLLGNVCLFPLSSASFYESLSAEWPNRRNTVLDEWYHWQTAWIRVCYQSVALYIPFWVLWRYNNAWGVWPVYWLGQREAWDKILAHTSPPLSSPCYSATK